MSAEAIRVVKVSPRNNFPTRGTQPDSDYGRMRVLKIKAFPAAAAMADVHVARALEISPRE